MDQAQIRPVLRCEQCKKPFDQESSLKRHGYYCRSKSRKLGPVIRPRSCISCAKGKARCDHKLPECSRCTARAIECRYPTKAPRETAAVPQHVDHASSGWHDVPSLPMVGVFEADGYDVESGDAGMFLDSALATSTYLHEVDDRLSDSLNWNDWDVDLGSFIDPQRHERIVELSPPELSFSGSPSMASTYTAEARKASFPNMSIPRPPSLTVRSFVQRQRTETGTQRIASLVLRTLKSYPLMILRQNTVPPFIHPSQISQKAGSRQGESLDNCINLIHMINGGMQGNRKLFWRNVRLECERMLEEHLNFDRWELLAAMQALGIYIIVRLGDGETEFNNFDTLMLATVTVSLSGSPDSFAIAENVTKALAKQLNRDDVKYHAQSRFQEKDLESRWKDWIFVESGRRLCTFFGVVNMLVNFEPSSMCDLPKEQLVLAPLPAEKQLWKAGDEFTWQAESEGKRKAPIDFGLATNGELVEITELSPCRSDEMILQKPFQPDLASRSTASWEEWCSGMDEFGGLVMLAASLTA